ncbi:MAG: HAMP domain-containing sensor histidine kinase [Chloroflexota bacterium]
MDLLNLYLALISVVGLLLIAAGLIHLPNSVQPFILICLLGLVALVYRGTTLLAADPYAAVANPSLNSPFQGFLAAVVVALAAYIGLWVSRSREEAAGRRPFLLDALVSSVAMVLAALVYSGAETLWGASSLAGRVIPWLAAAVIGHQTRSWLWLLVAHGRNDPQAAGRSGGFWALPLHLLVMSLGGGLLALALREFDWLGASIFFLPVLLAAYAFHLYARGHERQKVELERTIARRTRELVKANEELATLHRDKDAFLAILAHEMRAPLNNIRLSSGILEEQTAAGRDEWQFLLTAIQESEKSLSEMVGNLLDIEFLQSGAFVVEAEEFDLGRLVGEVMASLQTHAQAKSILLKQSVSPSPLLMSGDRRRLQQVLTNLVANAIKYTPDGGAVSVRAQARDDSALIEVSDTGYGIPAEELPFIFDRFRRVRKHQDKAVGTGLGLAIVQSIVQAHQGEVSVTSQEGVGSTFQVRLPLRFGEPTSGVYQTPDVSPVIRQPAGGRPVNGR